MELKEPKRKRSAGKIPQLQTLPVLIESISGITACNSLWPVYVGTFSGDSVIVSAADEMTALYKMGFFGKGCFSRGYPAFGDTRKGIRFIRERQWKRRKLWIDQLLSFSDSTNVENIDDLINNKDIRNKQSTSKDSSNSDVEEIEIIDTDDTITNQCGSKSREPTNSASSNGLQKTVKGKQSVKHVTDSKFNKRQSENSGFSDIDVCSLEVTDNTSNKSSHNSSTNKNSKLDSCTVSDSEKRSIKVTELNELDNDNSVLIIDDSDSDGESRLQSPRPRLCEESIKTAVETLNLTLEEAFFLSFGLGCLQVVDLQGIFLSLRGMWHLYNESQPNFISSYVTYHYFRSKGWIVKPGTKFGGNFLLYKQGPQFYHASYIVLIEEVNNKINESREKKQLTWTKVLGLTRIAESAGKEILISQVQWPSDITEEDLNNPKIISKFKVQEVLFRRWNSGHEREEKE